MITEPRGSYISIGIRSSTILSLGDRTETPVRKGLILETVCQPLSCTPSSSIECTTPEIDKNYLNHLKELIYKEVKDIRECY